MMSSLDGLEINNLNHLSAGALITALKRILGDGSNVKLDIKILYLKAVPRSQSICKC